MKFPKKKRNNPFILVQFEILCVVFAWCVQIVVQNFMEIWEFLNVLENKYHNLMNGPRAISENLEIFTDLIRFIIIQVGLIGAMVKLSSDINMHNQMNCLLYQLVIFLDKIIWNENSLSEYTVNRLPIKYNWMWKQHWTGNFI